MLGRGLVWRVERRGCMASGCGEKLGSRESWTQNPALLTRRKTSLNKGLTTMKKINIHNIDHLGNINTTAKQTNQT
jgi:hypothetical protein